MANCSIPNSTPATGRTSTPSLKRSKKPVDRRETFASAICYSPADNAQRSTLNAQRSIPARRNETSIGGQSFSSRRRFRLLSLGRWTLDVERWAFSAFRRVKGAWWPSRSSKPSSSRKSRGRFDSYPLRQIMFDGRCLEFDLSFAVWISHQPSILNHQTSNYVA